MKYLKQIFIILTISFVAEFIKFIVPLPITASIYGIILMYLALHFKVIKVSDVKETSTFLIDVMPVMFIPAAVGIMETWGLIQSSLIEYVVVTVVVLWAVMIVSGRVTQGVIKARKRERVLKMREVTE